MLRPALISIAALVLLPATGAAQHTPAGAPPSYSAPREVSQYDFLLGEWELTIKLPPTSLATRIHGMPKLLGTWKARRALDGFGIMDELRITDQAGNPRAFTQATRIYDAGARRWSITSLDVYRSRFQSAAGEWKNGEMHLTGSGVGADGAPLQTRTRIYDITADGFKFQQDHSADGGKSWKDKALLITAKRTAPAGRTP